MVYSLMSRQEFYSKVVLKGTNPSRWAGMVPPPKEEEPVRSPLESWDDEVSARELYILKESWDSEVRQRDLRIGSH